MSLVIFGDDIVKSKSSSSCLIQHIRRISSRHMAFDISCVCRRIPCEFDASDQVSRDPLCR